MTTVQIEIERIIQQVSDGVALPVNQILSNSRKGFACTARFILAHRLRAYGLSVEQVGEIMNRGHSGVLYYLKMYDNMISTNRMFRDMVHDVELMAAMPTSEITK